MGRTLRETEGQRDREAWKTGRRRTERGESDWRRDREGDAEKGGGDKDGERGVWRRKRGTDEGLGERWRETEKGEAELGWLWEKPADKQEPKEVAESQTWQRAQP